MAVIKPFLQNDHVYLLITILAIAFENFITGIIAGIGRKKVFTKDFMRTNFRETHMANFGYGIIQGGYPDMGNGYYSKKLDYKNWFEFNSRQRAHYNSIENIVAVLPFIFIGGINLPIASASFGLIYLVGRIIYSIGYIKSGPKGRTFGGVIKDVGLVGTFIVSIISIMKMYNGTI